MHNLVKMINKVYIYCLLNYKRKFYSTCMKIAILVQWLDNSEQKKSKKESALETFL